MVLHGALQGGQNCARAFGGPEHLAAQGAAFEVECGLQGLQPDGLAPVGLAQADARFVGALAADDGDRGGFFNLAAMRMSPSARSKVACSLGWALRVSMSQRPCKRRSPLMPARSKWGRPG